MSAGPLKIGRNPEARMRSSVILKMLDYDNLWE
jgi:hypothetical protein